MNNVTWPNVAMMIVLSVFILSLLIFLAWLAKYWDVFGDNKEGKP